MTYRWCASMLLAVNLGMLAGCSTRSGLNAKAPQLDLAANQKTGGSFQVQVADVSDESTCAQHREFSSFCVRQLRTAIDGGIRSTLGQFINHEQAGDKYRASFQLLDFSQEKTFVGDADFDTARVILRWRFDLKNQAGRPVLRITESTDRDLIDPRVSDDVLESLLEDVMERIAKGLNEVDWPSSRSYRPRPQKPRQALRDPVERAPEPSPNQQLPQEPPEEAPVQEWLRDDGLPTDSN